MQPFKRCKVVGIYFGLASILKTLVRLNHQCYGESESERQAAPQLRFSDKRQGILSHKKESTWPQEKRVTEEAEEKGV